MNRLHIGWYGVATIISCFLQSAFKDSGFIHAGYLIGSGDVLSTLLLALLIWAIGIGVMMIVEIFSAIF